MIRQCKSENRGLNCRGLAIALNECFLSLGYKSRYITCMPKDSTDNDCHVINIVFIEDLKKWMWVDPTNNAYVMDERGYPLSIQEVRERLINNKSLILNLDANWNNQSSVTPQSYLFDYMTKNLYYFVSPSKSEYNLETAVDGKEITYIELLPLDADRQKPDKTTNTNNKTGVTVNRYKTNNPDIFWQVP